LENSLKLLIRREKCFSIEYFIIAVFYEREETVELNFILGILTFDIGEIFGGVEDIQIGYRYQTTKI